MDVSRIIPMLGSELNRSLPCFHAFTDSDSVNAFSEMGWVTILKLVRPIKSSLYFKKWRGHGVKPHS